MRRLTNQIHPMECDCPRCSPPVDDYRDYHLAAVLFAGGFIAMLIDVTGLTPAIAAALGMMS